MPDIGEHGGIGELEVLVAPWTILPDGVPR
jgi:hypothetical protein